MGQMAFFQNTNECTGCRCCQVACKDKNDLEIGFFFREVADFEGDLFPDVWTASLSMSCNHCDSPACMANCSQGAITKEDKYGFVLLDADKCSGCQTCVEACPYGAPVFFPEENKVRKCDGCIGWIENGMQPACVGACSTRCLKFGEVEALAAEYPDAVRELSVIPEASKTNPNFLIMPKPQLV